MRWFGLWLFLMMASTAFLQVAAARALEFRLHPNNKSRTLTAILATGDIEAGDTNNLRSLLRSLPPKKNTAIYLASGGGSLGEGLELGLFFREARIKTVIEGGYVCASACALAFLGGTDNEGKPWRSSSTNSQLGFHAFTAAEGQQSSSDDVQNTAAQIIAYGHIVNAPIELMIANFATPSDQIYWVSYSDICALGIKLWSVEKDKFVCNN